MKKEFLPQIDLSKRLPGYINKWIFRFFLLLIGLIVIFDISKHGVYSYSVSCPDTNLEPCLNPYYVCQTQYEVYNMTATCSYEIPSAICKDVPCDKKYLEPGEYYGRTDFISKYGTSLLIGLFLFSFIVNHLYFMLRTKKLYPKWK